jgi:hypothetical protein
VVTNSAGAADIHSSVQPGVNCTCGNVFGLGYEAIYLKVKIA